MRRLTHHLYFWVLLAIISGGLFGYLDPGRAVKLKPLGDGFIALVKMLISPVIFCTVVLGINGAGDMKKVGRVGGKALLYFEVISTFALIIGLTVVNVVRPGAGFNVQPGTLDANAVADYAKRAATQNTGDFILHVIPTTFLDAFTGSGDLLQVLFVAILFGYAMMHMGASGKIVHQFIEACSHIFFAMMNTLMKLAPVGAGGAMAFTIGRYGVAALRPLALLMGSFYLTCLLFIFVVLGTVATLTGFSILRFIAYIGDEILTVLGTASSESALVPLMQKLGETRLLEVGGRAGRALRILVQSRWNEHLSDNGSPVRCAGLEHRPYIAPAVDDSCRGHVDFQGCFGRHRRRFHHTGGYIVGSTVDSRSGTRVDSRYRPLHVRSAVDHKFHRQRRRNDRRVSLGEGTRSQKAP